MIQIRPATVEDAEAIARVKVETWRDTYKSFLDPLVLAGLSIEDQTVRWRDRLRQGQPAFTACLGGDIVGFGVFGANRFPEVPCDGELHAIYIHPQAQGKGAGLGLMRVGVDQLLGEGYESMAVFVFKQNTPGVRFYQSLGAKFYNSSTYELGGREYPDEAYIWSSLHDLRQRLAPS
jgi:ribosomal protein S18 acetylase RimI-like enzyme